MSGGRPPKGSDLVDRFDGSAEAKERLKAIIDAMTGASTVAEVCARLGVGESRFYQIRDEMLTGALASLEPRMPGRPPRVESEEAGLLAQMDKRIRRLELELEAAHVRTELALTMPELMRVPGKKNPRAKKAKQRLEVKRPPRKDG
jgi:transposase-like protein